MRKKKKKNILKDKTALVTGSTSGIGLGIARSLAAAGANITYRHAGLDAQVADNLPRFLIGIALLFVGTG